MKKKSFCKREYGALKTEILERIKIMNSQAANAAVTILTVWSMAIALTVVCYSEDVRNDLIRFWIMLNVRNFVYLIPVLFFIPLAVKSGENMKQLASLSAYIKVFYEFPCIKRGYGWETFNSELSNISVDRGKKSFVMRRYNGEYTILSVITLIMFVLNSVGSTLDIRSAYIQKNFLYINNFWILNFGIYIVAFVGALILVWVIHYVSCVRINLMDMATVYLSGYIELAKKKRIITDDDYKIIYEVLSPVCELDEKLFKIKAIEKWKYKFSFWSRINL